jgi:hypothetical protein
MAFEWTEIPESPSAGGNIVHVDPARPDDSGDGSTPETAKKTLLAGYNALTASAGSLLLLKRGGVWTDEALGDSSNKWHKSGASAEHPLWIAAYGDEEDERPKIRTNLGKYALSPQVGGPSSVDHLRVVSIDFECYKRNPDDPAFTNNGQTGQDGLWFGKAHEDILFEDCRFAFYSNNVVYPSSEANRINNVRFRRCIFDRGYPPINSDGNNLFVSGHTFDSNKLGDVLIEECIFWHGGWEETHSVHTTLERARRTRDLYLSEIAGARTIVGNLTADGCSGGLQCRTGGTIERNLSLDNPIGFSIGHSQTTFDFDAVVRYNVVLGGRNTRSSGEGSDATGRGFSLEPRITSLEMAENIVSMNTLQQGPIGFNFGDSLSAAQYQGCEVRDNIVHRWHRSGAGEAVRFERHSSRTVPLFAGSVFEDNVLHQPSGGYCISGAPGFTWPAGGALAPSGNTYRSANAAGEQHFYAGSPRSTAQLVAATGETGHSTDAPAWPDPDRTIATYMATRDLTGGGVDEFMALAVQNRKGAWDDAFTAAAVIDYIREGFGLAPLGDGAPPPPPPEPETEGAAVVTGGAFLAREVA